MPIWELQSLPGLKQVEARLRELSRGEDSWTPLFSDSVIRGGKRLRPAMVLLCGSFYATPQTELVDMATAIELIHTASLVHDDVIDHAASRRGHPTVSAKWGDHQAVLYGDFLFARAFSLLTKHGQVGVLENMTRAISLMCEGEIEQAALRFNPNVTEADYISYIHKKTAYFISACCLAGAEACDMPPAEKKALATFGLQLGYAFQMTDDLLDYTANPGALGKPTLQDLKEGYLTLPVIRLLKEPRFALHVRKIIENRDFTANNMEFISRALQECGILQQTQERARTLIARAKRNLEKLPQKPPKIILSRLADYVVRRTC
ncbi:polyprenyl synthetase family protein [Dethiobacter alkaliphilus]|uniref:polyprenyl synthetase family protein n=1 Tax=Dethiobacter alkaliphilus TaxID=427926 RepID=UPI002226FE0E|nr:polyprenyl synthetase family protein [Dethiobacter alkaliphilus]MCW3489398.1 polyprenyl synthetase family protein [Dethiobacter alkaliphilus]